MPIPAPLHDLHPSAQPKPGPGLTLEAIRFAASHDWFIEALVDAMNPGRYVAIVNDLLHVDAHRADTANALELDGYTLSPAPDGGWFADRRTAFRSLRALREWAGY